MRRVHVETFVDYVRTGDLDAIEAALRQSGYDIDAQDDVSTGDRVTTRAAHSVHVHEWLQQR